MLRITANTIKTIRLTIINWYYLSCLIWVLTSFLCLFAQTQKKKIDSIVNKNEIEILINPLFDKNNVKKDKQSSLAKYINYQNVQKQNKTFNLIELEIQNAKFILNKGFNYKAITKEIDQIKKWEKFAVKGIVGKKFRIITDRNLSSTSILLDELLKRTNNRLTIIKEENEVLSKTQEKIDSLVADKYLYYIPTDSIAKNIYFHHSSKMNSDVDLISKKLKNALDSIQLLKISSNQLKFKIETDIIENNKLREAELNQLFTKKVPVFQRPDIQSFLIKDPFAYSIKTNNLVLYFYFINNKNSLIIMLLLMIGTYIFLKLQKTGFYTSDIKKIKFSILIF